jgi:hypothetical protein
MTQVPVTQLPNEQDWEYVIIRQGDRAVMSVF